MKLFPDLVCYVVEKPCHVNTYAAVHKLSSQIKWKPVSWTPQSIIICVLLKTVPSIIQIPFAKFLSCITDELPNTKSF